MANKSFFDSINHKREPKIIESYYTKHANLVCKMQKTTENLNSKISKTKNGRLIMQSKCAVCESKKEEE